jgi:hypothetical protein
MAHDLSPSGSLCESLGVIELRYTGWPALPPDMFPFYRIVEAQLCRPASRPPENEPIVEDASREILDRG